MYVEHKGKQKLMSATNQEKLIVTVGGSTSSPCLMEDHKIMLYYIFMMRTNFTGVLPKFT